MQLLPSSSRGRAVPAEPGQLRRDDTALFEEGGEPLNQELYEDLVGAAKGGSPLRRWILLTASAFRHNRERRGPPLIKDLPHTEALVHQRHPSWRETTHVLQVLVSDLTWSDSPVRLELQYHQENLGNRELLSTACLMHCVVSLHGPLARGVSTGTVLHEANSVVKCLISPVASTGHADGLWGFASAS